jgi:hypothetical protein
MLSTKEKTKREREKHLLVCSVEIFQEENRKTNNDKQQQTINSKKLFSSIFLHFN